MQQGFSTLFMYISVDICVYAYMRILIFRYINIYIYEYMYIPSLNVDILAFKQYAYTHISVYAYMRIYIYAYTHIYIYFFCRKKFFLARVSATLHIYFPLYKNELASM